MTWRAIIGKTALKQALHRSWIGPGWLEKWTPNDRRSSRSVCRAEWLEHRRLLSVALTTLYSFETTIPSTGIAVDSGGNVYGTGSDGPAGSIWEHAKGSSKLITLWSFVGGADGQNPIGITVDSAGNLYGTTNEQGASDAGTVWELAKGSGTVTTLYSFTGGADGGSPSGITVDSAGNLYGVTTGGGDNGSGTVWELPEKSATVLALYSFTEEDYSGGSVGSIPVGIAIDSAGNLYGTIPYPAAGDASVWELPAKTNALLPLAAANGGDIARATGITIDGSGNLFVTDTGNGGIYELAKGSAMDTLVDASGLDASGNGDFYGIAVDHNGNLYLTVPSGGVYELSESGAGTSLYSAAGVHNPQAITIDGSGNLYGIFASDANDVGSVWELPKGSATITTLYSFTDGADGGDPEGITIDSAGDLYGTCILSNQIASEGTIWELAKGTDQVTTLYTFKSTDNAGPCPQIAIDSSGDIYGASDGLGPTQINSYIWELAKGSTSITTIYSLDPFSEGDVGAGAAIDSHGNLYMVGDGGEILELPNDGSDSINTLYNSAEDGESLISNGIAVDGAGNVYGATLNATGGTVWELPSGSTITTTLYSFTGGADGAFPNGIIADTAGNLYGLTGGGGHLFELMGRPAQRLLAFAQQPANIAVTSAIGPIAVDVEDSGGNILTSDSSDVTIAIAGNPSGEMLIGTTTVTAEHGVATFSDLTVTDPGTYTLIATGGNDKSITSSSFTVSSTPNNQLVFVQQPVSATTTGALGTVTVDVDDSSGNPLAGDVSDVTLAIASGPPAILGGANTVAAVNGVATFSNLSISTPGVYTLTATVPGDLPATSGSFTITSSATNQLAFVQQPTGATTTGTLGTVTVDLKDSNGNVVKGDNAPVTLTLVGGTSGANLTGTTTIAAVNGVATFSNLSISTVGNNYTLTATDGSDTPATSAPFNIIAAAPPSPVVPTLGNVSLPSAVVAGSNLKAKIPVTVTNSGNAFKGDVMVNIYADTGTSLGGNQVLLDSSTKNLSLKSGKAKAINFTIKSLPSTLPYGVYHLLAEVVDPSGKTNVVATAQTVTVAAAFIHPTVSVGAVTPSSLGIGKSGSISITVTNSGNVPASGINIMLSPSTDGLTPVAGIILDTTHSGAKIQPGKSKTFKLHFKVSSSLAARSYFPYISVMLGGVSTTAVGATQFTVG